MPETSVSPTKAALPGSPVRVPRSLRGWAWASFVSQTLIIATGGAVRLTGSGLGCPSWPTCTPESLIPTEELSYHSLIEFGNRLMTGVVGIIALLVIILLVRSGVARARRDLWTLGVLIGAGIIAQAIVGGITVWTGLNPFIVGFHYVSSLLLVCVSAAFLLRMNEPGGARVLAVPRWYAGLAHLTTLVLAVSITFGVLTTGAGPHSGDAESGRNGFDASLWEHIHAWPGYALLALTVILVAIAAVSKLRTRGWGVALLLLQFVQVAVGLYQARNGLPPFAVGVHMVLAALTAAAMTLFILRMKRPVDAPAELAAGAESR
ncbi:MAG: COX15/CtaA family protein [Microbacteriaceae bacterium]|jgi:cytochrome c oxidase assembly protein subunit 15|nr:COX15/CtaA family protein [Microbacteriaceae bacterium]HPZ35176.1 COX15/CtaA family protein [Microbacteriaceae bacterium]HQC94002.1 COX15/CtaA family protein [Microbacteriaceae bacterium]